MQYNPSVILRETIAEDVKILGTNLRERDSATAARLGIPAHRALWRIWKKSLICKTVFINDQVVAIFGLTGMPVGRIGNPWFMASPAVEDYPLRLAFCYRRELKNMLNFFPTLEDWVLADDEKTLRLLGILGFEFEEPKPLGEKRTMFIRALLKGQ